MRTYLRISGLIFAAVALLHLSRLLLDVPAQVGGWSVPAWLSWIGTLAGATLSVWAFRLQSGKAT